MNTVERPAPDLVPPSTRVAVHAALVLIALVAIWLIDGRAMQRMHETQAVAALPRDVAAARVQTIAEAELARRYGERADSLMALMPMQENRLRWTVLFVPATEPGDPPPREAVQVHVDAATGRVQYVRWP